MYMHPDSVGLRRRLVHRPLPTKTPQAATHHITISSSELATVLALRMPQQRLSVHQHHAGMVYGGALSSFNDAVWSSRATL